MSDKFVKYEFNKKYDLRVQNREYSLQEFFVSGESNRVAVNSNVSFEVHDLVAEKIELEKNKVNKIEQRFQEELEKRWIQEKERAKIEGYTEGLNLGKKEALVAERPILEEKVHNFIQILNELDSSKELVFKWNEKFLTNFLSRLVSAIVLKEIHLDPDYVGRLILDLIAQTNNTDHLKILISNEDSKFLDRAKDMIGKELPDFKNIHFSVDKDIPAGGCKIVAKTVNIDTSVDKQIERAIAAW